MRYTNKVSVWPVGIVGGLRYEGPLCSNGTVTGWHSIYEAGRAFRLDMAAFAVSLPLLVSRKMALFDPSCPAGYVEGSLLKHLINGTSEFEPKANNCSKVSHMRFNGLTMMFQMKSYCVPCGPKSIEHYI